MRAGPRGCVTLLTHVFPNLARMRIFLAFILAALAIPAVGDDRSAVAALVQQQLQRCWNLPPGFEGQRISIDLTLLGDGSLDAPPSVALESKKSATRLEPLTQSVIRAVQRCAPFTGFDALGADPAERFAIKVHFEG